MTLNPFSMTNYRDCDSVLRVTNDASLPGEGVGYMLKSSSLLSERSIGSFSKSLSFVPRLSHNLLSL